MIHTRYALPLLAPREPQTDNQHETDADICRLVAFITWRSHHCGLIECPPPPPPARVGWARSSVGFQVSSAWIAGVFAICLQALPVGSQLRRVGHLRSEARHVGRNMFFRSLPDCRRSRRLTAATPAGAHQRDLLRSHRVSVPCPQFRPLGFLSSIQAKWFRGRKSVTVCFDFASTFFQMWPTAALPKEVLLLSLVAHRKDNCAPSRAA